MNEYVEVKATFKEKLLFLLLGVISKSVVGKMSKNDNPKPPKREKGATYTHYPVQDRVCDVEPDNPWPRSYVPDKPTPPQPPPIRVIKDGIFCDGEKMPDIPFFELMLNNDVTKSNL